MRKSVLLLVLVICLLLAALSACTKQDGNQEISTYKNMEYGIKLQYPKGWKANKDYAPPKYEGEDGFFHISAMSGLGMSIDEAYKLEAEHKLNPYGSNPEIKDLNIDGQEARLILPSEDQPEEMQGQASLVIEYPSPMSIGGNIYGYLILWADKEHILQIGNTIEFLK